MKMTTPEGVEIDFEVTHRFVCRCGAPFQACLAKEWKGGTDVPFTIHKEPFCKEFIELDVIAFLRWNRTGEAYPS